MRSAFLARRASRRWDLAQGLLDVVAARGEALVEADVRYPRGFQGPLALVRLPFVRRCPRHSASSA
jgi:hypothetical protein